MGLRLVRGAEGQRIFRNTVANYVGAFILAAAPIATLPIYLRSLGELQWGLVGFSLTLQALLSVLDAGMSQVLIREFSSCLSGSSVTLSRAAALLRVCQRLYLTVGLVVLIASSSFAWLVSRYWLHLPADRSSLGVIAVIGGGALCACYLPGVLYRAVAIAGQKFVALNTISSVCSIIRFGGGAAVVSAWPHLSVFLVWHVSTLGIEVLARRALAWKVVGRHPTTEKERVRLGQVVGAMGLWTVAAVLGAIATQMDKTVLSAMRPIGELASYFVASQIALGLLQIFTPLILAMLPVLLRADVPNAERIVQRWRLLGILFVLGVIVFVVVLVAGRPALEAVIDAQRASEVAPILTVLVAGISFNALCNVGYIDWLSKGKGFHLVVANIGALTIVIGGTISLVPSHGVLGGAYAWSAAQLFVLILSLEWVRDAYRNR